jgi:hypothetical protein
MFGLLALLFVVAPPHFRAAPGCHVGTGSSWAGYRPSRTGTAATACLRTTRSPTSRPTGS